MKAICLPRGLLLGFLFLETGLLLELGILDDLVRSRSRLRAQQNKIWH